jgi:16S rRNA (guanine527-N7)-methyltransferase
MTASGEGTPAAAQSSDLEADRERALALTPVSRETLGRLDRFVALLLAWQEHTNLISRSSVSTLWTRHIADSLQLIDLAPSDARIWVDLGAGGGFPGMVVACALAEREGAQINLIDSTGKKATFLREAVRVTGAPAVVHGMRIEDFVDTSRESFDVVTARALAPLPELLGMAYPLLKSRALGLFPKGQDVAVELTMAAKYWNIQSSLVQSRTDSKGQIVIVRGLESLNRAPASRRQKRGNRRR